MQRKLPVLTAAILGVSLSGCQLVEALMSDGGGQSPVVGVCGEYQVVATDEQDVTPEILEQTRTIIENRVNATGVAEPIVVTQGEDRISVELPGVEDQADIRGLIRATGALEFTAVPPACALEVLEAAPEPPCLAEVEPLFDGTEIDAARISSDPQTGEIVIDLMFKATGARLFDEHAEAHLGEQFAIVLDGIVESAPSINAPRFGGQAQISGNLSADEANRLATVLRFGSLPLEIREIEFGACEVARP